MSVESLATEQPPAERLVSREHENQIRRGSVGAHESLLIGGLLKEEEDVTLHFGRTRLTSPLSRSVSAPPVLSDTVDSPSGTETVSPEDYRSSPEYYAYYYLQRPPDPRLPPPLFNWSSWQYANQRPKRASVDHTADPIPPLVSQAQTPVTESELEPERESSSSPVTTGTQSTIQSPQEQPEGPASKEDVPPLQQLSAPQLLPPQLSSQSSTGTSQNAPPSPQPQAPGQLEGDAQQQALAQYLQWQQQLLQAQQAQLQIQIQQLALSPQLAQMPQLGQLQPQLPLGSMPQLSPMQLGQLQPQVHQQYLQQQQLLQQQLAQMGYAGGMDDLSVAFRALALNPNPNFALAPPMPSLGFNTSIKALLPTVAPFVPRAQMASYAQPANFQQPAYVPSNNVPPRPVSTTRSSSNRKDADPGKEALLKARMLEEFRLNKFGPTLSLLDVVDRNLIVELATDQHGSRFIQQKLEVASLEEKQMAFEQILPETLRLCTDVFGNYAIQKFFEYGTYQQQQALAHKMHGNVLSLSMQMYGCRVVQKAIDVSDVDTQAMLVTELVGHVMRCVKDQNGNHVIQKCIEKVPALLIQFIVEDFTNQVFYLSTHPYGCRVIQRVLQRPEVEKDSVIMEILDNVHELCKNQYGNYVIQHIMVHGSPWHRSAVIQSLRGRVVELSKHKFASNVCEKCFTHCTRAERGLLLEEVLETDANGNFPLVQMVMDQYANYVVQRILDLVDVEQRDKVVSRIKKHVPNLRRVPYGKHIITQIEKLTGKPL